MQSENIAKMLYNPLTFRKKKASPYDLMYMVQPQKFLKHDPVIKKDYDKMDELFKYMG